MRVNWSHFPSPCFIHFCLLSQLMRPSVSASDADSIAALTGQSIQAVSKSTLVMQSIPCMFAGTLIERDIENCQGTSGLSPKQGNQPGSLVRVVTIVAAKALDISAHFLGRRLCDREFLTEFIPHHRTSASLKCHFLFVLLIEAPPFFTLIFSLNISAASLFRLIRLYAKDLKNINVSTKSGTANQNSSMCGNKKREPSLLTWLWMCWQLCRIGSGGMEKNISRSNAGEQHHITVGESGNPPHILLPQRRG